MSLLSCVSGMLALQAQVPVVTRMTAGEQEREVSADGGRAEENGEQDGWRRRGRGPQGRMSSCLANESLAVEAPSTLLTSSFVLHHQPSRSPPICSLEHIISRL